MHKRGPSFRIGRGKRPVFLWKTGVTGFGCKATPTGRRVFLFQYRTRGQDPKTAPKRVTLGKYGELTPDRAQELAATLPPRGEGRRRSAAVWRPEKSPTMSDLAERFLQEDLPANKPPPRASAIRYYETLFRCGPRASGDRSGLRQPPSVKPRAPWRQRIGGLLSYFDREAA